MSTSLTTLVPVLNGANYTSWAPIMQSFLMSQGQWKVIMNPPPKALHKKAEGTLELLTDEEEMRKALETGEVTNQQDILDWWDLNAKPLATFASVSTIPSSITSATLLPQLSYGRPWRTSTANQGWLQFIWSQNRRLIRPSQPTPTHHSPLRRSLPILGSSKRLETRSPSRTTCRPSL